MKRIFLNIACIVLAGLLFQAFRPTEKGHDIEITIKGLTSEYVILAYYYAEKPYIKDTIFTKTPGTYRYKGDETLKGGMYMVVIPPNNNSFDMMVDADDQHFKVSTDLSNLQGAMQYKNSKNNLLFKEYVGFLNEKKAASDKLVEELKVEKEKPDGEKNNARIKELEKILTNVNDEVIAYQKDFIQKNPTTFVAKFIKTSMDLDVPEPPKQADGRVDSTFRYRYYVQHYFEHCDLSDGRLLQTPLLPKKVDRYLDQVIPQHPDTVAAGVDRILALASNDKDMFKYFVISLLNKYAKTKVVCMDAVYVHIADNYYLSGKVDWLDEKQMSGIKEDADRLRPLLCNKIAPDIMLQTFPKNENEKPVPVSLHGINAKYTVLIFWAPDCGHCKKTMPLVAKFYDEYKSKGVEVFSVCTKTYKDYDSCVKFIEEQDMERMLNLNDPYLRSKFPVIYDVKSTPVVFVLDQKKKIVSKRIGGEQLGEVLDNLFKREEFLKKQQDGK
jgi:thiol-disulfide isomerase/thioredoxin